MTLTIPQFKALGSLASCHLDLMTNIPLSENASEVGLGSEDIQRFNLTNPITAGIDAYLDQAQRIGCRGGLLTISHGDGLVMMDSVAEPNRNITKTAWWRLNGKVDIARYFASGLRARNMAFITYYDVGNNFFYHNHSNSWTGVAAYIKPIIAEVLTVLRPDIILNDGWGQFWETNFPGSLGYGTLPHDDLISFEKATLPELLAMVNDHSDQYAGDIRIYEEGADAIPGAGAGATAPNGAVFYWARAIPANWNLHSDTAAMTQFDIRTMVGREGLMRLYGYVMGHNFSIGPEGTMSPSMITMLPLLENKQPDTVFVDDNFALKHGEANDITLQARSARDGIAWVKTFGNDFQVGPQGELWRNGSAGDYQKRVLPTTSNHVVEAEFIFKGGVVPSSWAVAVFHTCDIGGTHDYRYGAGSAGTATFFTSLDKHASGALTNLESESGEVTIDPTKTCMIRLLRRGATLIAQLWQDGIKRSQLLHDDSTFVTAEYPGLEMSCSAASDTTGVHVTRYRVYTEQTDPPLPPTLTSVERLAADGGVLLRWNAPDPLDAVRIYRAEVGGDFVMIKEVSAEGHTDVDADPGTAYLYALAGRDTSYNVSSRSNVLSVADVGSSAIDLSTPLPNGGTVGDSLEAALAQGFGKWVIHSIAETLTLYAPDNTTILKVFDIGPNMTSPLTRTPQ